MNNWIEVKGARIHNLKNIDINIPVGKLTVITGVSGSGKSSLAFDTLFEEGKRRYMMFSGIAFGLDSDPMFDSITGISPTVAVEQRVIRQSNPRSTVGTRTKIGTLLAMLFSRYGIRSPEYDDGLPLNMAMFQKNSAKGMCVRCLGKGSIKFIDEEMLYGDMSIAVKDVLEGKFHQIGSWQKKIEDYYKRFHVSPDQNLASLSNEQFIALKYGSSKTAFGGVNKYVPIDLNINKRLQTDKRYAYIKPCPKCNGTGLGEAASHTTVGGKTKTELEEMYIRDLHSFFKANIDMPGKRLISEIVSKLECMNDVGLYHLSLSRTVPTLSGGEIQRLFLASHIITEMNSIIFIFDEPTIGLHEVEKQKLINTVKNLIKRGNTVIAVEHDENFMKAAEYIVDLGPHAGEYGGERIFQGSYDDFINCTDSLTAPYLTCRSSMPTKTVYKSISPLKMLSLNHCYIHNLRDISVDIPLGIMVGVAGVSGSGKSSLIADTLVPKLKEVLKSKLITDKEEENESTPDILADIEIKGFEYIKKCIVIDQRPIGRNRTSCPATYTGVLDKIRSLFAKESGMDAGLFSVNSTGGCRACKGDGVTSYHLGLGNFIELECESCSGTGFVEEAMTTLLDGKNICEIMSMSVSAAIDFFKEKDHSIVKMLMTLERVGMGYIGLGQKTSTISGGEAQRIKLATELGKSRSIKGNVYILDEPTTGLSFSDTKRLLNLLHELMNNGATVIVTEHDPCVLSNCDYMIEMGPGGGNDGGYIIATGTPEALKKNKESIIGRYLK